MTKRKIKGILGFVATSLCLCVGAFSLTATRRDIKASAASEGGSTLFTQDVVANYNVTPASYLGIAKNMGTRVTFGADETVTFAKTITVGADKTDLIDFAPHPTSAAVNGGTVYTYDLEEVKIRVDKLDATGQPIADSYIEIVVFTDTENRADVKLGGNGASDDWTGNGLGAIYAYGPNQEPVGYRNVNGVDRMSKLGASVHFSFYKGGAKGRVSNDRLLLQYISSTNSLHFANAVRYGTNPTNIIRDFDTQYYADESDKWTRTETNTFAGFSEGDKLQVSVTTVGNTMSQDLFFYQTGGQAAVIPVHVPVQNALILDNENKLTIPAAKLYTVNGLEVSDEDLLGKAGAQVKIEGIGQGEAGADLLVQDFAAYEGTGVVGLPSEGKYRFTYKYGTEQYSAVFEAMTAQTANAKYPLTMKNLKADWTADNRYPANISEFAIPVSATMVSEMDRNGFDTVRKTYSIYKDVNANGVYDIGVDSLAQGYVAGSTVKKAMADCELSSGESFFNVDEEGTYFVVYKAKDGSGRTLTSLDLSPAERPQAVIVSFSGHRFVKGVTTDEIIDGKVATVSKQMINGSRAKELTLSKSDIRFYDYRVNSVTPEFTVTISVTNPNGITQPYYSDYSFPFIGEYKIDYVLYYTTDAGERVEKTITKLLEVCDDVAPTLKMDDDAHLDEDKNSTEYLKYVRATVGSRLLINNITAEDSFGDITYLREAITCVLIKPDGTKTDLTQTMKNENYYLSIPFDELGMYFVIFEVEDAAGNSTMVRYEIDVRTEWLNVFVLAGMQEVNNSADVLAIPNFRIKGVAGNVLTGKSGVSGLYNCTDENNVVLVKENVAGTKMQHLAPGAYYVKYSVSEGENVHEKLLYFTIVDTTKPTVSVSGGTASGKVGEKIELATFTATDNGIIRETSLTVKLGDEDINVYENGFIPDKEGEYTVIYTAVDVAGNQTVAYYTVTVNGKAASSDTDKGGRSGCGSVISIISVIGALVVAGGVVLTISLVRKNKQKNEK